MSLFEYVGSNPSSFQDPLGLWIGEEHDALTAAAFNAAAADNEDLLKSNVLVLLQEANKSQDGQERNNKKGPFWDDFKHYNARDGYMAPTQATREYANYIARELKDLDSLLQGADKDKCQKALYAIGRLTHSWQDFFGHAVRDDGFTPENTKDDNQRQTWMRAIALAWTQGLGGTPDKPFGVRPVWYWESSYDRETRRLHKGTRDYLDEHFFGADGFSRPPEAEVSARKNAAIQFVAEKLKNLLVDKWWPACRCYAPYDIPTPKEAENPWKTYQE